MNIQKRFTRIVPIISVIAVIGMMRMGDLWQGLYAKAYVFTKKTSDHSGSQAIDGGIRKIEISWSVAAQKSPLIPVLVMGTGSAGMVAASYCARNSLNVVALEGHMPGGALTQTSFIDNWPGRDKVFGTTLMDEMRKQAKEHGVIFIAQSAAVVDTTQWPFVVTVSDGSQIYALTIIVATGSIPRRLHVNGDETYWGKGVTTCALCDAPLFKNKSVVVVGGGDSALEEAMQLSAFAKEVTVLVRGKALRASVAMQKRIGDFKNVSLRFNTKIKEIFGNGNQVTGITLDTETGIMEVPMDGVFIAIGQDPSTKIFKGQLQLDDNGYITLSGKRNQATSVEGIFAAGDNSDHEYKQAGVAAGDAIRAAVDAQRWLQKVGYTNEEADRLRAQFFKMQDKSVADGQPKEDSVVELTSLEQFEVIKKNQKGLLLLECYTQNCPACKRLAPIFADVAATYDKKALFYKANLSSVGAIGKEYAIKRVPAIVIFKDGVFERLYTGPFDKKSIEKIVENGGSKE